MRLGGIAAAAAVAFGACYAEVGGALYPVVHQRATPVGAAAVTTDSMAWGLLVKVGFYLDIPVRPLRSAIGIGLSPAGLGGEALAPAEGADGIGVKGTDVRLDVAAPVFLLRRVQPRLSLVYSALNELSLEGGVEHPGPEATGASWFAGGSLGAVTRGSTVLLGLGLQHLRAETSGESVAPVDHFEVSAWGVGARLLISWTPSGRWMKYYTPAPYQPQPRGNAGCYYEDHCDVDGNCTTRWVCP